MFLRISVSSVKFAIVFPRIENKIGSSPTQRQINFLSSVRLSFLEKSSSIGDRKSTRLNSSHQIISYAVFCLKKKKTNVALPCELRFRLYVSVHGRCTL